MQFIGQKYNRLIGEIVMQSLERLFGRELTNGEQIHLGKLPLRARPNTRSLSFCGGEDKLPHHRLHRETLNPNISTKVGKPTLPKEEVPECVNLKESLTDYFDESMGFMLSQELRDPLPPRQADITDNMRTILLDWIVEIHLKFKMFPRTLFLIAAIIDKYLSLKAIKKEELQLVGAAALFIGAKYEETYQVPQASELVNLSAKVFTRADLLQTEADIVKTLDFNLVFNTAFNFLDPFCKLLNFDKKKFCLSQYILELALLDSKFTKYKPSLLAASAIYLINKIKRCEVAWPDVIMAASGYEQRQLRSCARELCQMMEGAQTTPNIRCLRRKFGLPQFCEVSRIRLEKKDKSKY